jgi:hypothetical protein
VILLLATVVAPGIMSIMWPHATAATVRVTAIHRGTYVSPDTNEPTPAAGNKYVQIYATETNVNSTNRILRYPGYYELTYSNNQHVKPALLNFGRNRMQRCSGITILIIQVSDKQQQAL